MPRVRYVISNLHPADPQDGSLGDLALFHLGKCGTPGIFWNVNAGRHQKSISPTCSYFNRENRPREGEEFLQALSESPMHMRSTHWSTRVDTLCSHVNTLIIDLGPSGPGGSGGWSKTGSDEEKDPRTHGTSKTQTWALSLGKCAPSAWGRDYKPECPGLGLAPSIN